MDNCRNRSYNRRLGNRYCCQNQSDKVVENVCSRRTEETERMPLAMAYVPWQKWNEAFEADCGLRAGTIFPELVKPFWIKCGLRK